MTQSEVDAYLIRLLPNSTAMLTIPNPITFNGALIFGSTLTIAGAVVFNGNVTFNDDIDLGASADVILEEVVEYEKGFVVSGGDDTNDRGLDISGACATPISITGAFTTGINIAADGTTGIAVTSAFSGVTMLSLAGTGSTAGIAISGACGIGLNISGVCTTDIQLSEGATINNDAAGSLTITEGSISLIAGGYSKIIFGGATDWGTGATGTDIDGTGWDWVTQTVGHVDSGSLGTAVAAAYHAMTVTATTHDSNSSYFGTWTELYFVTGVVLTGSANAAAVWGQVEFAGTVTSPDSGDFVSAGYFNLKTGGLLTLTTDSHVSGIRIKGEVNSITGSGIFAAISVNAAGTDWAYGLYLEDITTGISIGACTTGIVLSGAMTDGILISGACGDNGIEISGACTGSAIEIVTGAFGIGLNVNADGTTGIAVAGTFSGTTMLSLAGTGTDGINISGICGDAIEISAAATTTGLNISADCVTGITIGAQTTAGITIAATGIGVSVAGATTTGLGISGTSTAAIMISGASTTGYNTGSILIADDAAGTALALGTTASGFTIRRTNVTAATTASYFFGHYCTLATSAAMADGFIMGDYIKISVAHLALEVYGQRGVVNVDVAQTSNTSNQFIGLMGQVSFAAAAHALADTGGGYGVLGTATIASGGTLDQPLIAGYFDCDPQADIAGLTIAVRARMQNYCDYGVDVLCQTSNGTAGIRIEPTDSAVLPHGISIETSDGSITNLLRFDTVNGCLSTLAADVAGDNTSHKIAIDIGGATHYIAVWSSVWS